MPKSRKQKKAATADFHKAQLKLGKGKQQASNATSTSYSAKTIALPSQNIKTDESNVPVTRLNLNLDDLITRLGHYSPTTRKDALTGLKELLRAHRDIWYPNLRSIIHGSARLIGDENPAVRKSLRDFYSWFFPLVDSHLLEPFCSMVIFFVCSALANIFVDVRIDAIHIIDILMKVSPKSVVSGWPPNETTSHQSTLVQSTSHTSHLHGPRLLQLYLSLCSIGPGSAAPGLSSTSATQLSGNAKLIVFRSLSRFIAIATAIDEHQHRQASLPIWIFRKAFQRTEGFSAFKALLTDLGSPSEDNSPARSFRSELCHGDARNSHIYESFTAAFLCNSSRQDELLSNIYLQWNPQMLTSGASDQKSDPDTPIKLLRLFHPVVLSIFLDTAPAAFQSETPHTARSSSIELIWCIINLLKYLWRTVAEDCTECQEADLRLLGILLEKMALYFPFGEDELVAPSAAVKQVFQDLNLIYSDLVSLLALLSKASNTKLATQLNRVRKFITESLEVEAGTISTNSRLGLSDPDRYTALLPIIWSLLPHADQGTNQPTGVLDAFISHLDSVSSGSQVQGLGVNFLARLAILDDTPGCPAYCDFDELPPQTQINLRQWVQGLPKLLWSLGHKNQRATKLILDFLHRLVSRPMSFYMESHATLAQMLVPFFCATHPSSGQKIYGPYRRLSPESRKVAQAIVWYLTQDEELQDDSQALRRAFQEVELAC